MRLATAMANVQAHFNKDDNGDKEKQKPMPSPPKKATYPMPKLRLQVLDLSNPGTVEFFKHLHPTELLREAILSVLSTLYTPENCPKK